MPFDALRQALGPTLAWVLLAALATIIALATLEGLVLARRGRYDWRAYFATLGDVAGRRVVELLGLSLAAPVVFWAYEHRVAIWPLDGFSAFALLFIGQELCYYAYHRAAHRVRWFWATHAVHHSSNELNLIAALRLGWTGRLTGVSLFFTPLIWLGFPPAAVLACVTLNLLYQFWLHATWIPRLWAPLEWLLNTPSHHRVHHGANPEYLDCNYGGVLIVFDRLFGTFVEERDDIVIRYGLSTPLVSYNPIRIALHEWARLARDLGAARSLRDVGRALFGAPRSAGGDLVRGHQLQGLHQR
jgi:sterol desaturase/sphingolipid hydroxylase (fatty acid hydroxylase superfamily)